MAVRKCSRFATFLAEGQERYGLVNDVGGVVDLSGNFGKRWPDLHACLVDDGFGELTDFASGRPADFSTQDIRFSIPLKRPEKIICVGVNYPDRNEEYKDGRAPQANPSLFVRFARSLVGHGQKLTRPTVSEQLDYEGEIAIVIGQAGRHIPEKHALSHIAALTLCNDGSVRDWVRHARFNVTQGKNFEGSGSMGPWLVPYESEEQIADIALKTRVNGELRQDDRSSRMIFSFAKLISYISTFTTLVTGDMIVTGTPTGAGARLDPPVWLRPGDIVEVEAEGIGILQNGIIDESDL